MVRYTLFVLAILGTAATAIAAVAPQATALTTINPAHETVISKNSPFPVLGPITVQECATEDCSDVQ